MQMLCIKLNTVPMCLQSQVRKQPYVNFLQKALRFPETFKIFHIYYKINLSFLTSSSLFSLTFFTREQKNQSIFTDKGNKQIKIKFYMKQFQVIVLKKKHHQKMKHF